MLDNGYSIVREGNKMIIATVLILIFLLLLFGRDGFIDLLTLGAKGVVWIAGAGMLVLILIAAAGAV